MALTTAFCENGNKSIIPQTTTDGTVSYDQGFGSLYALPPEEGGKFIERAQFNQLMYDTTSQVIANKTAIATKANADDTVNLTGAQTIQGVKTFTDNISSPNITAMQNNLNTIFSSTTTPVKTQTATKTITVGTGGNFTDLLSAVRAAKEYTSPVFIVFVSDLTITQDLYIDSVNGNHITINFQNYKMSNGGSSGIGFYLVASSIGRIRNLKLENINFTMGLTAKTALADSISIENNIGNGNIPLNVVQSSSLTIGDSASLSINTTSANLISASTGGIISTSPSATINTVTETGNLLTVYNGGILSIHAATTINKPAGLNLYNVAINTPSSNGLIFDKTDRD